MSSYSNFLKGLFKRHEYKELFTIEECAKPITTLIYIFKGNPRRFKLRAIEVTNAFCVGSLTSHYEAQITDRITGMKIECSIRRTAGDGVYHTSVLLIQIEGIHVSDAEAYQLKETCLTYFVERFDKFTIAISKRKNTLSEREKVKKNIIEEANRLDYENLLQRSL